MVFLDFGGHLVERDDVGIGVLFRPVKRAEFAIDIADVGVIDVAVNLVGDDFIAATVEILCLGELAAAVGEPRRVLPPADDRAAAPRPG